MACLCGFWRRGGCFGCGGCDSLFGSKIDLLNPLGFFGFRDAKKQE